MKTFGIKIKSNILKEIRNKACKELKMFREILSSEKRTKQ
jgi:hypothetical protein